MPGACEGGITWPVIRGPSWASAIAVVSVVFPYDWLGARRPDRPPRRVSPVHHGRPDRLQPGRQVQFV